MNELCDVCTEVNTNKCLNCENGQCDYDDVYFEYRQPDEFYDEYLSYREEKHK